MKLQTNYGAFEIKRIIWIIICLFITSVSISILTNLIIYHSISFNGLFVGITRFYLITTALLMLVVAIHLIMSERFLRRPLHWLNKGYQLFKVGQFSSIVTISVLIITSLIFIQLFDWLTNLMEGGLWF